MLLWEYLNEDIIAVVIVDMFWMDVNGGFISSRSKYGIDDGDDMILGWVNVVSNIFERSSFKELLFI
jgi:hypothetical protein